MKPAREVEELCKKLKPAIGNKADNLWHLYLAEDEKGRREFGLDLEVVAENLLKKDNLAKSEILLVPPSKKNSDGSILLGETIYNKKKFHKLHLRNEDFSKQVGIFAITGEGKTNLAHLLALQLLEKKIPFMIIDWKRSWRNLLSLKETHPELKDLQVYTIGRDVLPFFWNPFRGPPNADRDSWISTIADSLEKSHLSGQGVAYHVIRTYKKLFTGLADDFYPNFFDGKKEIENIKATYRELKWKQTAARIFQSFTTGIASKVFNSRNPIKLEALLNKPVIFELDLEIPKPLRVFFSEVVLRWIHLYRISQGETKKLRHVLFLEEVHNLFSQSGFNNESNQSLENVYREIRAFGQGIVSITQHPSMLPIYLLGNCHTQIYLGLQHADDIRAARKSLFLNYDEEPYFNDLKVGECIVKVKNRIEPCLVKTPLVPIKEGVVTDIWLKNNQLSQMFWKHSWKHSTSQNYLELKNRIGRILSRENLSNTPHSAIKNLSNTPRSLKTQIQQIYRSSGADSDNLVSKVRVKNAVKKKQSKDKYPLNISSDELLVDIFVHPFSGITQRYRRLGLNTHYGNNLKKRLISKNCIRSRKIITGKGWITLFEITQKGRLTLRDLGHDVMNTREGIVHKFWKQRVAEQFEKKGFKVFVEEYYVNGKPDIIAIKNNKKTAVEIETGKSNILYNIQKCQKAGFDKIVCVATSRKVEGRIRGELESKRIKDERVKVISVMGF